MRRILPVLVSVSIAASAFNLFADDKLQHLLPEDYVPEVFLDPTQQWSNPFAYDAFVRYKLVQPKPYFGFDALMICEPAFEREWAVAVDEADDHNQSVVKVRQMNQRIWGAKKGIKLTFKEDVVRIDDVTAATVRHCWQRLLAETRYQSPSSIPERIVLDADTFRFACGPTPSGQIYAPEEGTFPYRLVSLGFALRDYVRAVETNRSKLAHQIRHDATTLYHDVDNWTDRIVRLRDGARSNLLAHRIGVGVSGFSRDGKSLLTTSLGKAMVWDAMDGEPVASFSQNNEKISVISGFFLTTSEPIVATMTRSTGALNLWQLNPERELCTSEPRNETIFTVALSSDGNRFVRGEREHLTIWDAHSGKLVHELLTGHTITHSVFSPNGTRVVAAADDGKIRIFDADSNQKLAEFSADSKSIDRIAVSPDGSKLLVTADNTRISIWDLSGKQVSPTRSHEGVIGAGFTTRGVRFATIESNHKVRAWNFEKDQAIADLEGHTMQVTNATFSPDGKTLATGSDDQTVKLWDVPDSADKQ
jgi:WD40 repeat protein